MNVIDEVMARVTNVCTLTQPLPIEMKRFWALSDNKVSFQQIFIKWMKESQTGHNCVFFGGSQSEDKTMCIVIVNGSCYVERSLQCSYERRHDNGIMFHLNHAVKISKCCSVVIASPDTNIFVCTSLYIILVS